MIENLLIMKIIKECICRCMCLSFKFANLCEPHSVFVDHLVALVVVGSYLLVHLLSRFIELYYWQTISSTIYFVFYTSLQNSYVLVYIYYVGNVQWCPLNLTSLVTGFVFPSHSAFLNWGDGPTNTQQFSSFAHRCCFPVKFAYF